MAPLEYIINHNDKHIIIIRLKWITAFKLILHFFASLVYFFLLLNIVYTVYNVLVF